MAKRKNESEHTSMVSTLANHLSNESYKEIKADHVGHTQPEKITWKNSGEGHIPDVTATKNNKMHVFEIETCDSINDQHTEDQWKLFSAYAKQFEKIFIVVVPKSCERDANARVQTLGVSASVWTIG